MKRLILAAACLAFLLLPISAIAEPNDPADTTVPPETVVYDANTVESTFVVHAGGEAQPEGSSVLTRRAE